MQARIFLLTWIPAAGLFVFGAAIPVTAADVDGDGVDDLFDECCNTPAGVAVDAAGRPLGDLDLDCDTDLTDFELFQLGFTGALDAGEDRSCNPVAQTGCDICEKCTFVRDADNPDNRRSFCRPDGSVALGEACTADEVTGLDDCGAGLTCANGICAEICSVAPDSCPSGQRCVELPDLADSPEVGYCQDSCDPLSVPSDCLEGDACFLNLSQQSTLCGPPDEEGTQGVACEYLNGCASGYSCALLDSPVTPTGLVCTFICDASQGGGPTCADGPGATYTCVQINRFYSDIPGLPNEYGMCLDPAEWDEDGDSVLDFEDLCPDTPPDTQVDEFGCAL